jgi:hypothetical protein
VNLAVCASLPRTHQNTVWYRLILPGHLPTALSSAHAKGRVARFNPGPILTPTAQYATLSFADDPIVAQFEVGAAFGSLTPGGHIPHPRLSYVTLNVQVVLQDVIDLTEVSGAQNLLGTTVQELTGDWTAYQARSLMTPVSTPTGMSPTQELGMALFATGTEGFLSVSAKIPYHRTLTVFPDRLRAGSSLTFRELPLGTVVHTIP